MAKKQPVSLLDFYQAEAPFAAEVRRLLLRLRRSKLDSELKSVLITSSTLGEGKSTLASFLAITAAQKGMNTLLIDSDLRRPTLHRYFQLNRAPGLVEVLVDRLSPRDAITVTSSETLSLLTAGRPIPNPAEIFDAKALGTITTELKFYYDLIILDCAPVIPVSDPMLLGQEVDAAVLVVKAGVTSRELAARSAEILRSGGANLAGAIMNNMTGSLPTSYDYSRYEYRYEATETGDEETQKRRPERDKRSPEKSASRTKNS